MIAALYLRYSSDDSNTNSIENQKQVLIKYCSDNNITIFDAYIDIAKTGTNLNRPALNKLFKDLENKSFNTIIVKDLSRFSRNYLEAGYYLSEYFPSNNIRFIALNDNYDSINDNSMEVPIRNYLNTMYSNDIKKKIHKSVEQRATKSKLIKIPKYGYLKENNKLVIDPYASKVVRMIFELSLQNYRPKQIIDKLIEEKIYCPQFYKLVELKININKNHTEVLLNPYNWTYATIKGILNDYEYCGHTINIKNKNAVNKEKNILIKNTHQAIINEKTFKDTPKSFDNTKPRGTKYLNQFFKCSKCDKSLTLGERAQTDNHVYYCPKCKNKVNKTVVEELIYNDVKNIIKAASNDKETLINTISKSNKNIQLKQYNNQRNKCKLKIEKLLDDKISGKINEEQYSNQMKKINEEIKQLEDQLLSLRFEEVKSNQILKEVELIADNLDSLNYTKYELIKSFVSDVIVTFNDKIDLEINYKYSHEHSM